MGNSNGYVYENAIFEVELMDDKKAVLIYVRGSDEYERFDYREFGELIRKLEAIRRQMVLMPLPLDELNDDPNLYTTGGDY